MSASPAPDITRRVWQEVTRDPSASLLALERRCRLDSMIVFRALSELERLGYVQPSPHGYARRVLVPFAEVL